MPENADSQTAFDKYRYTYNDRVNEALAFSGLKVDFFTRVKADYLQDALSRHFADFKRVSLLDVGCGVGNYHPYLAGSIKNLSGTDVSEECLERARQQNPDVTYRLSTDTKLPFDESTFDCAFTSCVLHHVSLANRKEFISEFRRVIRPGGLGLIFEHNPNNPLTQRVVANCEFDHDAILLRAAESEKLLANSGFEDVSTRFLFSIPAANWLLRTVDGWLSHLRLGAQYLTSGTVPISDRSL